MSEKLDVLKSDISRIFELINRLEFRLSDIEKTINIESIEQRNLAELDLSPSTQEKTLSDKIPTTEAALELKIGQYWLAHLGTIVLITGIAFLISYPFQSIPSIITSFAGYLAVAGIFGLSYYWKDSYPYNSKILFVGGLVLLYYTTLRLHFFNASPFLSNKYFDLALLLLVLGFGFYFAWKRRNEVVAIVTLLLSYCTCIISNTEHFALAFIVVSSIISVYLLVRLNWQKILVANMILAYLTHSLLLFNNPLLGNSLGISSQHSHGLFYLFAYGFVISSAGFLRDRSSYDEYSELLLTLFNSIAIFVMSSLIALSNFEENLSSAYLFVSAFFLSIAVLYWIRCQSKFATSVYASFGYLALSIAIFARFESPDFFVWLSWQSLLVVSTAIWFRSRIIIVVNFLIYLGIFIGYIIQEPSADLVNFSYAIVALVSARILNWQQERLELQTDMIRNIYLLSAFAIVLIGLHYLVPGNYVSLAWLGAVLFYFGISLVLKNIKYRWLAILTIFATITRVFVVDMDNLGAVNHILLLLAIGVIVLVVSLFYSKHSKKLSEIKN